MANERKTEQIVRSHFEKSKEIINLEEQASQSTKIDKLLKNASKIGSGKGYPDFESVYRCIHLAICLRGGNSETL